jgi:DNA-directed RNA polymerase subunit RPC12/RpoP
MDSIRRHYKLKHPEKFKAMIRKGVKTRMKKNPKLYYCDSCGREFILDDEQIAKDPRIKVPYCPYCGRKSSGGWGGYKPMVHFIRETNPYTIQPQVFDINHLNPRRRRRRNPVKMGRNTQRSMVVVAILGVGGYFLWQYLKNKQYENLPPGE